MEPQRTINVFLTSFPGLNLPPTLSLPIPASTPISDLTTLVAARLPSIDSRLIITTSSNRQIPTSSLAPISTLLSEHDSILPLRLSVPLCGGKGGFGSQLRAAGGRMSSKRKRTQGENNGSNRNLDGRRLRTVNEAKALAEYLALKPDMEKKEKEARRKRWEQVVEMAEKREEEIKSGAKGRVDGKWVEEKEEVGEQVREAVLAAMRSGEYKDISMVKKDPELGKSSGSSGEPSSGSEDEEMGESSSAATTPPVSEKGKNAPTKSFFGFDEDDEFMSDEGSEDEDGGEEQLPAEDQSAGEDEVEGKGKGKEKA